MADANACSRRLSVRLAGIGDFRTSRTAPFESSHQRDSSIRGCVQTSTGWRKKERTMPIPLIWGITVAFGFLAWSVFAAQYVWPRISIRKRAEALRPILVLHGFRYIGLAVL